MPSNTKSYVLPSHPTLEGQFTPQTLVFATIIKPWDKTIDLNTLPS